MRRTVLAEDLRPTYQRLLVDPLARRVTAVWSVSPSTVTLLALAAGIAVVPALGTGHPWLAFGLLAASGFLDTLDGTIARQTLRASTRGQVLDMIADRFVDFSAVLGLYLVDPDDRGLLAVCMCGALFINMSTFLSASMFTSNPTEKGYIAYVGILGRSETFVLYLLMIAVPAWFHPLAWLFIALACVTFYQRVHGFHAETAATRDDPS